jgi:putative membrane protein
MMKKKYVLALFSGMIITVACESPVINTNEKNSASINIGNEVYKLSDEEFIKKAYSGNTDEIQLSELAKKKSTNKQITDFADMLIKDHQKANSELKAIAMEMKVKTPEGPSIEGKIKEEELEMKKTDGFDSSYINYTIKEHEKDIDTYKQASAEVANASLKKYAKNTMEVINKHLEKAKQISSALESSTSSNK